MTKRKISCDNNQRGQRVSSNRWQIKRGQDGVKICASTLHDRNRGIVNYEPEQSFKNKQTAESDDESRHFLAHDQVAHAKPKENAREESDSHRQWRRPFVLEYKNARDTTEKTDAASGGQVDIARKNNE